VKDALNFKDEGKSIFDRKKPLEEKTLTRMFEGCLKFIAGKKEIEIDAGSLIKISSEDYSFISKYNSGNDAHRNKSLDEPCGVITTENRHALVQPEFVQHYYGNGFCTPLTVPAPTITTKERMALVQPKYFIYREFKSTTNSSIQEPIGALTTVPKANLIEAEPFISDSSGVITANGKWHYIVNPSWGGNPGSIDAPCFTIVARQDKAPLYLIQVDRKSIAIPVYETDSPMTIKIKQFMALYGIIDIKMRMLRVKELLRIQGFPDTYKMVGNQSDHKKFIGNSVCPEPVEHWAYCLGAEVIMYDEEYLMAA
jgi:DNA (cytosine-5)-methyltransferase 1